MYCENCCIRFSDDRCPVCGSKRVRLAYADDLCFLTEQQLLWSEMLEDVLKQNGIPCMTRKCLGAGMALSVGMMQERVRFYVPLARMEEASRIVEELFAGEDESEPEQTEFF